MNMKFKITKVSSGAFQGMFRITDRKSGDVLDYAVIHAESPREDKPLMALNPVLPRACGIGVDGEQIAVLYYEEIAGFLPVLKASGIEDEHKGNFEWLLDAFLKGEAHGWSRRP